MTDILGADLEMDLGNAAVVLQGVDVVIDDALSATSKNPVQNRVVKAALDDKQNTLTAGQNVAINDDVISVVTDSTLSDTSARPIQNKVVKTALDGKQNTLTAGQNVTISGDTISVPVDSALSATSEKPVQNKTVKAALDGKQDKLTAGQNVTINGSTISADVDSAEIASNVTSWLNENVTPVGSAVVVDSSLSIAGAAADAKVTGDKFDDLKSDFVNKNYFAKTFSESTAIGTVDGYSIGTDGTYNAVAYTTTAMDEDSYYRINDGTTSITFAKIGTGAELNAYIRFYDDEFKPLGNGGQASALTGTVNVTASGNANLSKDAKYIKFGGSGFTQNTITVTNAIAGKFVPVNDKFTELIAQDESIQSEFDGLETWEAYNLVNSAENVELNKYWQGRNSMSTAEGYAAITIPVKAGKPYSVNGYMDKNFSWYYASSSVYAALIDTDAAVVGTSSTFIGLENFIPERDGYLRITSRAQYIDASISVVQSSERPSIYTPYGVQLARYLYGEKVGNEIAYTITVKKDGTGDFTKLVDAIEYSNNHPNTTIYVGEGTYDLVDELGAEYFESIDESSSESTGLQLYNNVHLIFASNSFVTCHYTGNNDYAKYKFSAFNARKFYHDGFIIENINLSCSNIRYCIHDETGGQIASYKNVYKNCNMFIDNTQNSRWTSEACIGGGLGCAAEIIIENCYFDSAVTSGWFPDVVFYHNTNAIHSPCRSNIVITGCYFAGRSRCGASHYGTHDETSRLIVSNCSLASAPRIRFEDQTNYPDENFELIAWNNEIRTA